MKAQQLAVCDVCGEPLNDGRPWVPGLLGSGAHNDCLPGIDRDKWPHDLDSTDD